MIDPIQELKTRAELLHHGISASTPGTKPTEYRAALERLRVLPEHRRATDDGLVVVAPSIRRKHCLAVVAREVGFDDWLHAKSVLSGEPTESFGTLLCPPNFSAHWNIWSASYEEARGIRQEHGGYLLAYKRHFFITDRYYIETLGLDPEDADWELIRRDWVRPAEPKARRRLYGKLLAPAPLWQRS